MTTKRSAWAGWRDVAAPVLRFLFPARCLACGEPLTVHQRRGACAGCWGRLRPLPAPCCARCALPIPSATDLCGPARGRCARCLPAAAAIDATIALLAYDRLARKFLLRGKDGGRPEILSVLGEQLALRVTASGFATGVDAVIPIPSRRVAALRRGFHPATEIARPLARRTRVPLRAGILVRRWSLEPAVRRLGRSARRAAIEDAFRAAGRAPPRVLLVDDVLTTGATAEAAAAALRAAGARQVRLAVWARTLPRFDPAGVPPV